MSEKKFQVGAKAILKKDGKILLLKSHYESTGAKYWDLPGGRFQVNDSDITSCLKREVTEELPGIQDIEIIRIVTAGRMPKDFADGTGLFGVFYEITATLPDTVELTEEHSEYIWLSQSEVTALYNDANRELPFNDIFYEACVQAFT